MAPSRAARKPRRAAKSDRSASVRLSVPKPVLPPPAPELTLSAAAWIKLQYLCHRCDTEVGAFGLSSGSSPLYIEDVRTVAQRCTEVSVAFDDVAVADFFEEQIELGRGPARCGRVWIHTHPGDSADPSGLDERTFDRVFGGCDWAVMLILARGGQLTCRLRLNAGSGDHSRVSLSSPIPVRVDYRTLADDPACLRPDLWEAELARHVTRERRAADGVCSPFEDAALEDSLDETYAEAWDRWLADEAYWLGQADPDAYDPEDGWDDVADGDHHDAYGGWGHDDPDPGALDAADWERSREATGRGGSP